MLAGNFLHASGRPGRASFGGARHRYGTRVTPDHAAALDNADELAQFPRCRLGFAPLYTTFTEVHQGLKRLLATKIQSWARS